MALPGKFTRGIVVDGKRYRWRVVPPKPRSDCDLCGSWHLLVITDPDHEIAYEWFVDVDPATKRPLTVTPRYVAEEIRNGTRRLEPKHSEHERLPNRARHRGRSGRR